jgi:truncated hemoglobin YjbI
MRKYTLLALLAGLLAMAPMSRADDALYKSLGGKKAITAVVDDFVGRVAADSRINSYFKATAADPKRLAHFKKNRVDQICEAVGGPCKYKGKDRKTAHAGMGVSSVDLTLWCRIWWHRWTGSWRRMPTSKRYSACWRR